MPCLGGSCTSGVVWHDAVMPTGKQRARAAKQAYRSVISSTGVEYSPRAYIKGANNATAARRVGKTIARSAARPGRERTIIGSERQKKALIYGPTQINFNRFAKKAIVHASFGEVKGMVRDMNQAYKKNLRQVEGGYGS